MEQQAVAAQNEQIFQQLLPLLQGEFGDDLSGVLAGGSRVHGKPGPSSDLDIHVVIVSLRRCRRTTIMDGIEVEQFVHPPIQIREQFKDGADVSTLFALGHILYDPQGIVNELKAEAKVLWAKGPGAIPPKEIWQHRLYPSVRLRDLAYIDPADEATLALVITETCNLLLETHYRLQQRWRPKAKRCLHDLAQWDAAAAQLACTALASHSLPERRNALATLAEQVLAPLGGLMPLEWSTQWEDLTCSFP